MARRRFYAPPAAFTPSEKSVTLGGQETRHARDVLRLHPGDEVHVFDGKGKEFRCAVREFGRAGTILDVHEEVEPARPESPVHLTLAVALLKGEKFDLVIQKTTELGVRRILPLETGRADVHLRDSADRNKRVARWRRIALEAAKQSGRAYVPEISAPLSVESLLATERERSFTEIGLMFSERGGKSLSQTSRSAAKDSKMIAAAIGPEGGWTDDEIDLARAHGWNVVTLGGRTLRAETAAIAIVALLQHLFGDLD